MSDIKDFDEASYEFTIGDEDKPELNVLQVGLVATFFFDKAAARLKALSRALTLYIERYGNHLQCGYVGENPKQRWKPSVLAGAPAFVANSNPMAGAEFFFSSAPSLDFVGDYCIESMSHAAWYEDVHKTVSYLSFYLPVRELVGDGQASLEQFILRVCELLRPLNGELGLGFQHTHASEDFQHLERELALGFNGLTVGHPLGSKEFRTGFKTVNWYTILDTRWVEQLGGIESIRQQLDDPRIQLLPYSSGLIVKAGGLPELGWVKTDPYPELYVKVNRVLKPVRAPKVRSFHYGSIAGEVRFDERSSNEWMRRFDGAPERAAPVPPVPPSNMRCEAGQPCPQAGVWFTPAKAGSSRHFQQGEIMPDFDSAYGKVIWQHAVRPA